MLFGAVAMLAVSIMRPTFCPVVEALLEVLRQKLGGHCAVLKQVSMECCIWMCAVDA